MYKCKYKCRVEHGTDVDEMESADFAQRYALTLALPMTASEVRRPIDTTPCLRLRVDEDEDVA